MNRQKPKHTPGPWYVGWIRQTSLGYWRQTIEGPKGYPVRPGTACGSTQQQAEATARLIAAAPDLLEAAYKATAMMNIQTHTSSFNEGDPFLLAIKGLQDAIVKAEGR